MADRYWVGGSGTWNASTTTNWSASPGGAGGASAPTLSDNAIFNASSGTGTITITSSSAVCLDMTASASSALTFSGDVDIYGSMAIGGSGTFTGLSPTFRSTTTGRTITTNAKSIQTLTFNGVGGAWTLQDALTVNGNWFTSNGTFNSNNFTINAPQISSFSGTRVINLGSSTVNLDFGNPINVGGGGSLTFNAGTSTINCTATGLFQFAAPGLTFNNVNWSGGTTTTVDITGTTTFNNLSITADTAGTKIIALAATVTINGTLSVSGTTATNRIQFGSSVSGTQRTLSLGTAGTLTNTNWKDIALTGSASPWSAPVGVTNLGNNTGITFNVITITIGPGINIGPGITFA